MSEPSEIQQNITEAQYAATSGTGNATITITNYYYREEARIAPADSADVADDNLPCPYRGLFHFGPGDAEYFFGRKSFITNLFQATQTRNFIPLLGASGSGKSSVVFAGLVPKLQQEGHWQFTHFRPGSDPFHALALALVPLYTTNLNETERLAQARQLANYLRDGDIPLADVFAQIQHNYPSERVLLIADQFEELYTLCPDETIRRNFLDKLTTFPFERVGMVLVLTMRADFLGNALSYRPFADVLQNTDLKLGPMNREELTEVIEKPAQKLGVILEAGLVERILDDVESEPGNLPLLEFALTELWQRRQGQQLTHLAYTEIGQVQGALARHANEEYDKLSEAQREQVRRIFIQLVRPGEGTEDTRRLATKAELGAVNWALVKQLADARLVVTSRSEEAQVETVEVVHEALIRNWGELRGWMDTDRVFRAWQERLRGAMGQWQKTQGDEGSWLRGAALAEAEEQLKKRPEDISQSEQDFIRQSLQERERIKQAEAARRRREIRTAWGIAAGSLVAVVISTGLGWMAWKQTQQAKYNQAESIARLSLSLLNENKGLEAFVQAIKAGKILQKQRTINAEVMEALQKSLVTVREYNSFKGYGYLISSLSFSPDGKTLASSSSDGTIKLWKVETGEEIHTLNLDNFASDGIDSVRFSPDSKTLVSAGRVIQLWNVETGKEIRTHMGRDGYVDARMGHDKDISFSPDSKTLASSSDGTTIKLWNVETGKEIRTLKGDDSSVQSVSFSLDGKILAAGSGDKTIKLWDVETGEKIRTLKGDDSLAQSVSFSPDGKTLVSGSNDRTIKLWDVKTGKEILTLPGHYDAFVESVSFSPDGKTLASGSDDDTIKLWDVKTGNEIRTLKGHDSSVKSVSFSPDGKTLASGSADGTVKFWKVEKDKEIRLLKEDYGSVESISFSPDSNTLASGGDDRTVKLWNVEKDKEIRLLKEDYGSVESISFSPDSNTLASGGDDGTIKLWDLKTEQAIQILNLGHESVDFGSDGKTLAFVRPDGAKLLRI
ncbi:MAG: WD40 repeat domain-containing protein [Microcystis sp. M53603_WE2]|jgi:WD40 repeat protein|uniref:WD40 repeat domain-containing protein n=1 Tax=unclassified Microcystis TaxID=2643300 RepID=UPI0022BB808B|nr:MULTISPECIES: WD40 repeat domain-containing protein [unclassified Microcystis]MCZ8027804.1 WD40 repeat domain-containing protein [Microcystis sp. LE19-10.1B]MCZ8364764.1 WD40 repeat domain-containing protein [Microcystis sp. LE19-251.1A]MDJ0538580.1 WD40 repeat domain-containing protein [Microcystis sp. M53603_WE2]MDJ0604407.1 WD40 repeat domain-containing protein [Microcystis sp. M53602_WE12]